jgi:hypothetical protein
METRVIGMIVLAGVVVQLILGHMDLVTPVMMNPVTIAHVVIGVGGFGATIFMTNKALKVSTTPITKYVMIIASVVILGQLATGYMLLAGMGNLIISHSMSAWLILALFVGHAGYAMYYAKKQKQ